MKIVKMVCLFMGVVLQAHAIEPVSASESEVPSGRIIFITGSCSSGKSSLAKLIAQDLDASYFAFDEYAMPLVLKKMVQNTVGKFFAFFINKLVVRNFFNCVGFLSERQKYSFQKKFYDELKNGIAIEPTMKMYRAARDVALQGYDVVVEAPLQLGEGVDCFSSLSVFKDLKVTFILAYCPWQNLVERIEKRNKTSKTKTHRELDWAIGNFVHCFDVSPECREHAIDSIQGSIVKEALDIYSQPKYKKKRLCILDQTKQATLQCFKSDGMHYIYPKISYDMIVNTKTYNPEQAAVCVLNFLQGNAAARFDQGLLVKNIVQTDIKC